jgi:hypothetical protein
MESNEGAHPALHEHAMLLEGVEEGDDPLPALRLLAGLRSHLDTVERQLIESARDHGDSWAKIADALGLASRQAAEQRLLRLAGPAGRDPSPERRRRTRQRSVDELHGAELAKLRPAVAAAARQLALHPQWTENEPRATLAHTTLSLAATAEPGPLFSLAAQALADLNTVPSGPPAAIRAALDRLRAATAAATP